MTFFEKFVIGLCTILLFISCQSQGEPTTVEPPVVQDTIDRLNLLFVGDIMGHGPQVRSAYDESTKSYNYEPCFRYVKPIIEKADFAIGNLEVTLPGKPPYKGYPTFRSPDALAEALKNAGFDMLVTANNHSNDGGLLGVTHTIEVLKNLGFYQTGTFNTKEERETIYPLIVKKNDFTLVFVNYTYGTNGIPDHKPSFVNLIDTVQMRKDMALARSIKPDAIIAIMHWGDEYQLIENKTQRALTEKLFNWGAKLVIGAHPHVVQPIYKKKHQKADGTEEEVYVAYSMGNFISNQKKANTDGGIMVEVELIKDKRTGALSLGETGYVPVWRYIQKDAAGKATFFAVPLSPFEKDSVNTLKMTEADKVKMNAFGQKTRKHLNSFGANEIKYQKSDILPSEGQPQTDDHTLGWSPNQTEPIFKIQWLASKEKQEVKPPIISNVEIRKEEGWFKYLLGGEKTISAARILLEKVKSAGFSNAFIVMYQNGKRVLNW